MKELFCFRSASKKSILGVTPRKALSRTRRHGSVRFDNSVPDKKGGSSETLQMTGSKIGLSDMDLTSVVSTLHNRVMKDHKSEPLHAAGTSTSCSSFKGMGQRLLISRKEVTLDWLLLVLLEAVS
jgi:hypothetical protein